MEMPCRGAQRGMLARGCSARCLACAMASAPVLTSFLQSLLS